MKNLIEKNLKLITIVVFGVLLIAAVSLPTKKDPNSPGFEFFPDMYRSPSIEVYGTSMFKGDEIYSTKFLPVKGTIARGYMPYAYADTKDGYEAAGLYLKNPIPYSEKAEKEGEVLYSKYCVHCHGATGGGDGKVGQKLPGAPPAYNGALKTLPEGKIFHSITYGKGLMGNHASMLTQEERWKLVFYVQKLQGPKTAATDSTKTAEVKPEEKKEEVKK